MRFLGFYPVVCARLFAPLASHQTVERLEIGARTAFREERGGIHGCKFFGDGSCDELIDADPISLGASFHLGLDRTGQPQRISALILHLMILLRASAGKSSSIPNNFAA